MTRNPILIATMLAALSGAAQAQVTPFTGTYSFTNTIAHTNSLAYNGTAIANLTPGNLTKVGVTSSSSTGNSRASNWGTGSTSGGAAGGSLDAAKYFEFTITAGAGFTVADPTITFGVGRSSTGPRQFEWRSSLDNYGTAIPVTANDASLTKTAANVLQTPDANSGYTGNTVSLTTSGQSAITFRFYAYGAESTSGTGGLQGDLSFSGSVVSGGGGTPSPSISTTGSLSSFTANEGTASVAQTFGVTGANLTADITVTAPADFEVASDGVNFADTATIANGGGSASGTVSVRIKASALKGAKSGNIVLSSTDATSVNVAATGTVTGVETLPFTQNFETDSFPFTSQLIQGSGNWTRTASTLGAGITTSSTNTSMQINGLNSAPTNAHSWLILGPLDCSAAINPVLKFTSLTRYAFSGNFPAGINELTLKFSTNYTGSGDPTNNGTWSNLSFIPPQNDLIKQDSGSIQLTGAAGQSNVYVAFEYLAAGITTGTALWQVDDVQVTEPAKLGLAVAINRGTIQEDAMYYDDATPGQEGWYGYAIGTVYLPEPAGPGGKTLDLSLNDDTELGFYVSADASGIVTASTAQVTVLENESSALFYLIPKQDYAVDGDIPVTVTASVADTSLENGTAALTVNNADYPSTSLTSSGYTADFSSFASAATLPVGWTLVATSTNYTQWGATDTGPKFASIGNLIFGYQHTGSTGTVRQVLTLRNDTGGTLNDLTLRYNGRVTNTAQGRDPFYAITVNGKAAPTLAYSTADGDLAARSASISGLNVPTNGTVTIIWQSDGANAPGSGSRKQIGLSDVQVTLGLTQFAPTVSALAWSQASLNQSSVGVTADLVGDGGVTIDEKGFVYARTADNANPVLDGTGVQKVTVAGAEAGSFAATLTGLTASTGYTIKAYAKNSVGTTYTAPSTFTTLDPTPLFGGYYTQGFTNFTGTLPEGWKGSSSAAGVTSYLGNFGSGSSAGYRGPAAGAVRGVLGYQHTTSSGTLTISLTLQNNTAAAITNLNVAYLGRVGRETEASVLRMPEWAVSFISGTNTSSVTSLTYSTTNGVTERKTAALTSLNIGTNEVFSLVWTCASPITGSGASRQIGISDLVVSTSEIVAPPTVTGGASLTGKVGEAILPYQIVADGSPIGYSASDLPAGLSVNPVTGELSGTPTAATSDVGTLATIAASNAGGTGTATITLTIAKGDSTLEVTGATSYGYNSTAQGPDTANKTGSAATVTFSYTGTGSTVYDPTATKPTAVGSYTATASVVADANYNGVTSAAYAFFITKGTPTITAAPTASAITAGNALSASSLTGGSAGVDGTFAWTDGTLVPSGTGNYEVTFTPTDLANYNTATTTVEVTVNPASGGFDTDAWLAGETMNPVTLGKLAIGGASSATANDGEKPVVSVAGGQLVLSAIVRTNGPAGLNVVGEAVSSLADYGTPASITSVNGVPAAVQGTVPEGCERQEFKVDQEGGRKFLRLKATLP